MITPNTCVALLRTKEGVHYELSKSVLVDSKAIDRFV